MGYIHETVLVAGMLVGLGFFAHWIFGNGWKWLGKIVGLLLCLGVIGGVLKGAYHGDMNGDQGLLPDAVSVVGLFFIAEFFFRRAGADWRYRVGAIGGFFVAALIVLWPLIRDGKSTLLGDHDTTTATATAPATAPAMTPVTASPTPVPVAPQPAPATSAPAHHGGGSSHRVSLEMCKHLDPQGRADANCPPQ